MVRVHDVGCVFYSEGDLILSPFSVTQVVSCTRSPS
jgi:hypothetical protein